MSSAARPEPVDADIVDDFDEFAETVDGEPVLDDDDDDDRDDARGSLVPVPGAALASVASPAMQVAAAAATGFVAGAATLAIARRREGRRGARRLGRRRGADALPIVGTRSFLIDIHMIRGE